MGADHGAKPFELNRKRDTPGLRAFRSGRSASRRGLAVALLLLASWPAWAEPPSETASAAEDAVRRWREDLAFLASELPARHKNLFFSMSQEDFDRRVEQLRDEIPQLSNVQVTLRLMEIVAAAGDGHTALEVPEAAFRLLPLRFDWFRDGLFVTAATKEHTKAFGARVVRVGDLPLEKLLERVRALVSHDNLSSFKVQAPRMLRRAEVLVRAGAWPAADAGRLTLEKDGRTWTIDVTSMAAGEPDGGEWVERDGPTPMFRQKFQLDQWNDWLPEQRTVYFKYNRCSDREGFARLVRGTRGFVLQNPVEHFVLDLRDNGGGDSSIFDPLRDYLRGHERFDRPGGLYVIIGRHTFSSAVLNALTLRDTHAVFVGEPSGGKPNHYGELRSFDLPHSGLRVHYSTKYFTRVEGDPDAIEPDIAVEPTFDDWLAGRDPVLELVLERIASAATPAPAGEAAQPSSASAISGR